ncbi:TIGR03960 family B12-binding radical SAM protein [Cyanobium sp. ATX 6F1]|uniref:TIGR03960 family B12-binding radical SAM protein n=1 Tax=unclassified Cyanobium TaxID=2627006 RepID=UPI0020CBD254|nr:TIGR03960 family B12-binding radical SAM protein [Cyanobium sp. ATX 6F1]MCP9917319.1 TIGR03960 family B12-binding radical SAM protein [Cyanobium sp. ATX 6F1]
MTAAAAQVRAGELPVPFEPLVDRGIAKPGRYLGNERGVEPRDWSEAWPAARVRWCLTYPELYEVGASNLGHILLYSILNAVPGQLCDRSYLPAPDLAARLREQGQPLFAVESRRALAAFDLLGFSLSYELGATNILEMLDLAGIPIRASERGDRPLTDPAAPPLIFAGGPTATSNPEPFAAFFDFIALGDGEELLPEIGLVVAEAKAAGLGRRELLRDLAQVPGVYVPSLYGRGPDGVSIVPLEPDLPKRLLRRVATPMPHYAMGLVPHIETVHDRLTIEIRRGCTRGCRFCQPGMLTRPARDVEPEAVIEAVETGMERTGYSDFSLLSLSCSDYLALPAVGVELRNRLAEHNVSLSLPSQRVDRFDSNIAHILGGTRRSGLTFAPEAGSQRLRDIVNKGLTDAELLRGIRTAMENGYRKVKLYFMIGLPGETDADVVGIANTCRQLQQNCRDLGRLELNLTISNFTPKPHTPFQWHSVSTGEFRRRQELLRRELRALRGLKTNFTDPRLSAMEDFVGRGDRRLAPVIEAAWRAGAGLDAWFETIERTHAAWTGAIEAAGLGGRYRALELGSWSATEALSAADLAAFCRQPLPWDHIDTGVDKAWLADDLQRALAAVVVPDCSFDGCSSCGVCGPEFGHNVVVPPPPIPAPLPPRAPASERLQRLRFRFAKTGDLALLSHLDGVRMLERALRRSGLPVSFTGGFHPLPRLEFALALPLGVEAAGDWLDLEMAAPTAPEEVLRRLQAQLPAGFQLLSVREVPLGGASLSQELVASTWSLELLDPGPVPLGSAEWQHAMEALLAASQWIWQDTDKKGRPRERDLRPYLEELACLEPGPTDPQGTVRLRYHARIDPQGRSLRPEHLQGWFAERLARPLALGRQCREQLGLRGESTPDQRPVLI